MRALYWDESNMGMTYEAREIPAEMREEVWRDKMIEAAAEGDETLLDKFLESGALRRMRYGGATGADLRGEIVVTMCGSAFKNKGVQAMLDAVVDYMPSPLDVPSIKGLKETIPKVSATPMTMSRLPRWHSRLRRILSSVT